MSCVSLPVLSTDGNDTRQSAVLAVTAGAGLWCVMLPPVQLIASCVVSLNKRPFVVPVEYSVCVYGTFVWVLLK